MPKLTDLAGTIRSAFQIGLRTATVQARSILFRSQFTGTLTWSPTSDVTQQLQDRAGTIALLSDLAAGNPAQVVQTYLTAGNFSTVIPSNCTHFAVQAVGSTGGGGGGRKSATAIAAFGGGGSASANTTGGWIVYSLADLGLSPGATLSGTIGAGGTGGAGTSVDSTNGGTGGNGGDTFLRIGASGTNYLVLVSGGVGAGGGTTTAGSGGGAIGGNTLIVGVAGSSSSATASPPGGAASSVGGGSGSAGSGISTANVAFATNSGGRGSGQLGFVSNPPAGVTIGAAGLNGTRIPGTAGTLIPGHGASGGGAALTGAAGKGGDAVFGGGAGGGGAARDGVGNSSGAGGNGAAGGLQIIFYSQSPGQPLDSDLTAIANLAPSSLGLIERTAEGAMTTRTAGATGLTSLAAGTQNDGRTAIGLEALAPATITVPGSAVKSVLQLQKPFDFNNQALTGFYLSNSLYGGLTGGVGIFTDRLQAAYQKYDITTTGGADISAAFDASYETSALVGTSGPAATPFVIEVDFTPYCAINSSTFFTYWPGLMSLHFADDFNQGFVNPAQVNVEILSPFASGVWQTIATITPVANTTVIKDDPIIIPVINSAYINKVRLTITPLTTTGFTHRLCKWEYFASRPDAYELPQYLLSASTDPLRARIPSLTIENKAGTAKTVIGQGTLQFNTGATQTEALRGVKTVTAPSASDTITVAGAQVGDIVRLSEAVGAKVTAPNTVTFNSTGLNGISVTAIVERFI